MGKWGLESRAGAYEKEAADALERLTAQIKNLRRVIRNEALRPRDGRSPRFPTEDYRRLRWIG